MPKTILRRLGDHRATLLMGVVVLGIVLVAARWLVMPFYLNLGYLELARRTPAAARARDFIRQADAGSPQAPQVARAFGMLALAEGDWSAAYSFLQRAAANAPDEAFAHWQLGRALDGMGNQHAAAAEYRLAGASSFFFNAALRARHQKDWTGAERNFLRALEIAPHDATMARIVGEFYREWGKPDRAQLYLERALEFEHRAYERALLLGELAELRDDAADAERAFQKAIGIMPADPEGYRLLSELYLGRGDLAGAIRVLETGSTAAAPAFGLNLRLAQLLIQARDWTAAKAALARANTEQDNSDEVYLITAQLDLAWDKPEAAVIALEQSLTFAPHNAETHFWLGRALAQTGQCEAARRAYAEAIVLAPVDPRFTPAQQIWGACQ